jgi:hypothetical protein
VRDTQVEDADQPEETSQIQERPITSHGRDEVDVNVDVAQDPHLDEPNIMMIQVRPVTSHGRLY